jgi:FixJ family two-component response regulator
MMVQPELVAIVDDDESVREALPYLLRSFGFRVNSFASAKAFLASESLAETACLVLDVAMPGMGGEELQIELAHRGSDIAIVVITARSDPSLRERMLARGASAFLLKPFSEASIVGAVTAAIGKT